MIDMDRKAFKEEAYEMLGLMEASLLDLEAAPDDAEVIGTVFRYMHTIKGSGAMFGFDDIAAFTHEVETVFDLVRAGKIAVSRELIDLTLRARDRIRDMLDCSDHGEAADAGCGEAITAAFKKLLPAAVAPAGLSDAVEKGGARAAENAAGRGSESAAPKGGGNGAARLYRIRFAPSAETFRFGANPANLVRELASLGEATVTALTDNLPSIDLIQPDLCYTSWDVRLLSSCGLNAIKDVFIFEDDDCVSVSSSEDDDCVSIGSSEDDDCVSIGNSDEGAFEGGPEAFGEAALKPGGLGREASQTQGGKGGSPAESGQVSQEQARSAPAVRQQAREPRKERQGEEAEGSIRVPSHRLDCLVNLVGEQVTVQARLSELAGSLKLPELAAVAEEVERLTAVLRENVLHIRMLPIGATFGKFKRLVRDLSNQLGKEIELTTEGAETELDKTVLEKIGDPLVHLIRNSIDHGVETPEARVAKGKPRQGAIRLAAVHSGDCVSIDVSDDGAGLDRDAILAKAVERGLVPAGAELSDAEIFAQIFAPGFSTARQVTSVSGRGVGMDVVKRAIESLRGSIGIASNRGAGTTITVRIPLTLAIIESLLVRIGDGRFAMPLSQVQECVELTRADLARAHGRHLANVRGHLIPYIPLREKFGIAGVPPEIEQIVITLIEGVQVGFVVDQVIGEHQTVIKSLGKMYRNAEGVSGATVLGDGSVALILDVQQLFRSVHA